MAIPSARNDDQPKQIPRLRRKLMDRLKASSEVNDEAGIMIIPLQQISNVGSQLGNRIDTLFKEKAKRKKLKKGEVINVSTLRAQSNLEFDQN